MTKIALINDSHLGARNDSSILLDHQQKFFEEVFFPYLDENDIKVVLDLGDTFDRRKNINFFTLKRSKEFFFDQIRKRGIDYHAVVGNHSVFYTNTNEVNSMNLLLMEYPEFKVYVHLPELLTFDGVKILMVPWLTKNNIEESLSMIEKSSAEYVMGHFSIEGFEMMKGMLCDHGLKREFFSRFEGVYSGHFHHPSSYGNIRYLGAQYEMNWGDYDGKRGFSVFDTKTRNLEFIENPNKLHHKIDYDDSDLTIEEIQEIDFTVLKNTFVKVLVKNRTNTYLYDLFMQKLNEAGAADVKTLEDTLNIIDAVTQENQESKDTRQILHEYVDSIETTINKDKIKSLIDNLYLEASSLE